MGRRVEDPTSANSSPAVCPEAAARRERRCLAHRSSAGPLAAAPRALPPSVGLCRDLGRPGDGGAPGRTACLAHNVYLHDGEWYLASGDHGGLHGWEGAGEDALSELAAAMTKPLENQVGGRVLWRCLLYVSMVCAYPIPPLFGYRSHRPIS